MNLIYRSQHFSLRRSLGPPPPGASCGFLGASLCKMSVNLHGFPVRHTKTECTFFNCIFIPVDTLKVLRRDGQFPFLSAFRFIRTHFNSHLILAPVPFPNPNLILNQVFSICPSPPNSTEGGDRSSSPQKCFPCSKTTPPKKIFSFLKLF